METLQPGKKIKPPVEEEQVPGLVKQHYGLEVTRVKELVSYDDKNFRIQVTARSNNPNIQKISESGYVVKIINSLSSKNTDLIEAQNLLMLHLETHEKELEGILFPKLTKTCSGKPHVFHKIDDDDDDRYVIRLLNFVPGKLFQEIANPTINLLEEIGSTVAKVDLVLESFDHKGYRENKTVWMLDCIELLEPFITYVKDKENRETVEEVIKCYKENVMQQYDKFVKGIIHGDFNEHNILVSEPIDNADGSSHVIGLLDYGDTCYSAYLFELAISITYAIIQTDQLDSGKHVLSGFQSVKKLKKFELQFLRECICTRLCQSLVMGAYTLHLYPENTYVSRTALRGWKYLHLLSKMDSKELLSSWNNPPYFDYENLE